MYIKVCGPNHTGSRHSDTGFPLLLYRAGQNKGINENNTRTLAPGCGNDANVSKDGDGGQQESRGPGAR